MDDDRLVVTPLDAQEDDPELDQLRHDVDSLLPQVELVDVLTEVNSWCSYLDTLTHADNATHRTTDHTARLLAVIAAYGCNIGIEGMARSTEFTVDQLAWTKTWHLRTETVRAANDAIVNHQISQPITETWGTGTLSSSDGQRFPLTVKSPRASRNHSSSPAAPMLGRATSRSEALVAVWVEAVAVAPWLVKERYSERVDPNWDPRVCVLLLSQ